MTTTDSDTLIGDLGRVVGRELMRLPTADADIAFDKLGAGMPKIVVTGTMVTVLFADGSPFFATSVRELTAPQVVEYA